MSKKVISIVTPCFNEEVNVTQCYLAIKQLFEGPLSDYDYEHVFCDNDSSDNTVHLLKGLAAQDPRVKIIVNARNFGALRSNYNGVMATTGDAVLVFLPADLQDPPEVIPELVKHWEAGNEVVYGIRAERQEGLLMRTARRVFYRLVRRMADIDVPVDAGEFQLIDRKVVTTLRQFEDYYPYIRGMIASCGFKRVGVPYTWKARERGYSKARFYSLIDQALNAIISLSNVPMRLCMFAGCGIAALSILYGMYALIMNLVYYRQLAEPGIPTLIVAVFFFSGLQMFFFGILGEYISAIHFQVRKRPLVIERERINFDKPAAEEAPMPARAVGVNGKHMAVA
ncbi:MAG: glycosyltransferase family 2 protein [Planctomycetes bacterium]|nr:glycosyltransferase family 2 protein [Planctomycetota bacterium]